MVSPYRAAFSEEAVEPVANERDQQRVDHASQRALCIIFFNVPHGREKYRSRVNHL